MKSSATFSKDSIDVIIPTFNNPQQLQDCLISLNQIKWLQPFRIIVVQNGTAPVPPGADIVLEPGRNVGWTGGLEYAMMRYKAEFTVFCNDDIVIPSSSLFIFRNFVRMMRREPRLGALGPITNCAMGRQNMWNLAPHAAEIVPYLIGFFKMVRTSAFEEIGGVDVAFPTGDDIDDSIRFYKGGWRLGVSHRDFVFHHGFQTGERVHGSPDKPGGWNSAQMTRETNAALIRRHGFLWFWKIMTGRILHELPDDEVTRDTEGNTIREIVSSLHEVSPKDILEVGCGSQLTIEGSVGLDKVRFGQPIPQLGGALSVATVQADVETFAPDDFWKRPTVIIARHILEHVIDPLEVMRRLRDCLNPKGVIIIAVPNEESYETVPLNPEHKHAFTPASLLNLADAAGFVKTEAFVDYSHDSFILIGWKEY